MSSLGAKGLFGSANNLQIADVGLRVFFFLFWPFFCPIVCLIVPGEMSEMITFTVLCTKAIQPCPRVFLIKLMFINLQLCCTFDVIGLIRPTRNGKII